VAQAGESQKNLNFVVWAQKPSSAVFCRLSLLSCRFVLDCLEHIFGEALIREMLTVLASPEMLGNLGRMQNSLPIYLA